ncbi:MAG TPA: hypothetical protein VF929_09190 [Gemmatimonadaceae bacterium]
MSTRLALLVVLAGCSGLRGGAASPAAPAPVALSAATPPVTFVRSTAESRVTRTIDVRDGLTHAQAMRTLIDALGQRYTVDVADPRAGFVMTTWQAPLSDGVPDLRYRTRVTARFQGDDWKKLQVRGEANWVRGEEWDVGYDAAQLDSATGDLRAKLGKRQ